MAATTSPNPSTRSDRVELKKTHRFLRVTISTLVLLAVGFGVGWAGNEVFGTREVIQDDPVTYVKVRTGVVESSKAVNVLAQWPRKLIAPNGISGTVTRVQVNPTEPAQPGSKLYEVNLAPVIALKGNIPSFRELNEGTSGEDVAQIQAFLETEGYLFSYEPGFWRAETTSALRAWQTDNDIEPSGSFLAGQVVFVPELPARIVLDSKLIHVGSVLSGGEEAIFTLGDSPSFRVPLTDAQASAIPIGVKVEVNTQSADPWNAWVIDSRPVSEDGGTDLILGPDPEGEEPQPAVCSSSCSEISTDSAGTLFRSRIILVEETRGMVLPSAAITSNADGKTVVVDSKGKQHEVKVLAGARGLTAVEGLRIGMRVQAPAEASL